MVGGHGQCEPELGVESALCRAPFDEVAGGVVELEAGSGPEGLASLGLDGWSGRGFGVEAGDEFEVVGDGVSEGVGEGVVMGAAFVARGEYGGDDGRGQTDAFAPLSLVVSRRVDELFEGVGKTCSVGVEGVGRGGHVVGGFVRGF